MPETSFFINAGIALAIAGAFLVFKVFAKRKINDLDQRMIQIVRDMKDDELVKRLELTDNEDALIVLRDEAKRRGLAEKYWRAE